MFFCLLLFALACLNLCGIRMGIRRSASALRPRGGPRWGRESRERRIDSVGGRGFLKRRPSAEPGSSGQTTEEPMLGPTAHIDTFARDNLPPPDQWPDFRLDGFDYPEHLNAAVELTDRMVERGFGDRTALIGHGRRRTYKELADWSNRLARALIEDYGVKPGNRVLIRSANNPAMIACWLAATKAGAVVVNTMPMLRAGELTKIVDKAEIKLALCDTRILDELVACAKRKPLSQKRRRFRRHRQPRRRARPRRPQQAGDLRRCTYGKGRCRVTWIHLRNNWRPEGDGALSSRHPHYRRRLCEAGFRGSARGRVRRVSSDRLHLRARGTRCVSAALRRFRRADRKRDPAKPRQDHRSLQGDRLLHGADRLSRDARGDGRRSRPLLASRRRIRGRDASSSGLRSLDEAHGRADSRRHRLDGNAACVHRKPSS